MTFETRSGTDHLTSTGGPFFAYSRNYSGSREEVQLLADKSFGRPEKKLNFWLSS